MKFEIFGKNYNPSDSLKAISEKKCSKLNKYFKDDAAASVKMVITLVGGIYSTELIVECKGSSFRAQAESDSPFDNIDKVIPKLLGQMRKQKDNFGRDVKAGRQKFSFRKKTVAPASHDKDEELFKDIDEVDKE